MVQSPAFQLPRITSLSKETYRPLQSPSTSRRRDQPILSLPGIKQGPKGHEAIIWPLLALRLRLPRPVLISVPKYMGSYISYFSVEIQALHLKIRHIY